MQQRRSRSADAGARRTSTKYSGRSRRSILPSTTIAQQCSNMRTLRRYSSSFVGVAFSNAFASGSYTARRPRCTIRYGKREVVAEARIDLDVVLAPHGVDRAVAAGDRVDARLVGAQRELVAPVDALPCCGRRPPGCSAGRRRTRRRDRRSCGRACAARRAPTCSSHPRTRRSRRRSAAPRCSAPRPCRRAGCGSRARRPARRAPRSRRSRRPR